MTHLNLQYSTTIPWLHTSVALQQLTALSTANIILCQCQSANQTTSDYDVSTKIIPDGVEYLATIYIGNPITQVNVIVDTGSGHNWGKGPPVYDPKKSVTHMKNEKWSSRLEPGTFLFYLTVRDQEALPLFCYHGW